MKHYLTIGLVWVLLLSGGRVLAQSTLDRPGKKGLYATVQLGAGWGNIPHCERNVELVNHLGIGWQVNDTWRLGLGSHLIPGGEGEWIYLRRFWGTGLQATWNWRGLGLTVEGGHAWWFKEGCSMETTYESFSGEGTVRPYLSVTPRVNLTPHIHLFVSWLRTATVAGESSRVDYVNNEYVNEWGSGTAYIQSLQGGFGIDLGPWSRKR